MQAKTPEIPLPTPEELLKWDITRSKQKTVAGPPGEEWRRQPVEGWSGRLTAMEADGRLYRIGNMLYRR